MIASRLRSALLLVAFALVAASAHAAPKPKPEKLPVAFVPWTGKSANAFKGVLKGKLAKECVFVGPKKARVLIEGTVTEKEPPSKAVTVKVVVKSAKTGEIVETKEFVFPRPSPSGDKMSRMAKAVVEITRRAPTE